jgi:hypothetical protein
MQTMKPDWMTTEEHDRWIRAVREACDADPTLKAIVEALPNMFEITAASCWLEAQMKERDATDLEVKNLCMDLGNARTRTPWETAHGLLVLWSAERPPAPGRMRWVPRLDDRSRHEVARG